MFLRYTFSFIVNLKSYMHHQGRMFTADESGTVTLPLTIPPGACSLTLANHGSGGPSQGSGGGLAQTNPLGAGSSLGAQAGSAPPPQQPTSLLPTPFLLPAALPMQPVHQVSSSQMIFLQLSKKFDLIR